MKPAILTEIIKWTIDSAIEAMGNGERMDGGPEMDVTTGLWQSFRAKWPEASFAGPDDYALAITALSTTYRETMIALVAAVTPADPIVRLELDTTPTPHYRAVAIDANDKFSVIALGSAVDVAKAVLHYGAHAEIGMLIGVRHVRGTDDGDAVDQFDVIRDDLRRTVYGTAQRAQAPREWIEAFPEAWSEIGPAPKRAQR
jgi:hypothetical protein